MRHKKDTDIVIITATKDPVEPAASQLPDYGVGATYERNLYDSHAARENFHRAQFDGKKTITGADGETLHKSHSAAKSKYGAARASYHQAEADHKDPLKNIHTRAEKNPVLKRLLTDADIKEIGNRGGNFQELSKHENTSKGKKSELRRGLETKDPKRVIDGVKTQAETDLLLTGRAVKNATTAAVSITQHAAEAAVTAGTETALITLTVSGLNNLACVASGQKDLETALKDVAADTVSSFASGAGVRMTQEAVAGIANALGATQAANFIANEFPSAEIAMAVMTCNTVKQYLDGRISIEDCAVQIIANGAGTLAYQLGMAVGGPAGAVVASVVMTQITTAVIEYRQEQKLLKEQAAEAERLLAHAASEIARQREQLRSLVRKESTRWEHTINTGFEVVLCSAANHDVSGISRGLNMILHEFNETVLYPSLNDFDRDFYDLDAPPLIL